MPLGLTDDHVALHETARRWTEAHVPPSVPRALLDADDEPLPEFWGELASMGWLGMHVAEEYGGQGYGLLELAVVVEELGRALAPGPFLPTVLAAEVVARFGSHEQRAAWLPGMCDGSTPATLAFCEGGLATSEVAEGVVLEGVVRPVLSVAQAEVLVLPLAWGPVPRWCVLRRDEVAVAPLPSLDATRRLGEVAVDGVTVPAERVLGEVSGFFGVRELAATLLAAEAAGVADWCVGTAASYAKVREQFGRPIGQFQAVKHRCADMLVRLEQARAAAWDAARGGDGDAHDGAHDGADARDAELALAASVAGALAPEAAFACAKDCIQVLGGIGFTWEHDAHMYLKRATAVRQLLEGPRPWREQVVASARRGVRRTLSISLPEDAEAFRSDVRAFLDDFATHDKAEWRRLLAGSGYLVPHYPKPWGLAATPAHQLVIDEEFAAAKVRRPHLQVGAWVLPTLVAHATPEQQERFVPPTLLGEITWCQLFSEPGAGSDLAGLSTKAVRGDGGWLISGQKVWTTFAHESDWGMCLARTDPDASKHDGITCFLVDMRSEGLDVRPLRELTGWEMFNEVFLEDVYVPDECVVGRVNDGWRVGRTTLENERVSMGSGSSFGLGVEALLGMVPEVDEVANDELGGLMAEAQSLAVLGLRMTMRAVSGVDAGPESSVRKLLGVEHEQRVQEVGLGLLGPEGAVREGDAESWVTGFLANRCLTIAGGTSEIQRNVIGERLLGLPKDA